MKRQKTTIPGDAYFEKRNLHEKRKKQTGETNRPYMTVREMGDLLGLKKTDRYWLVHKGFFETKHLIGKTWIDIASFEKWYANQVKYHKVTGEEPGTELKARSYSPREIAEMLGICEQAVYELIKRDHIETVTVDYWMRVPKEAFEKWYASQSHYRTTEDREKISSLIEATVSMPEMARMLGVTRSKVYWILKSPAYQHFFEIIMIDGRKRITKESLQQFLEGQDVFMIVPANPEKNRKKHIKECIEEFGLREKKHTSGVMNLPTNEATDKSGYLTTKEATEIAHISKQALFRYIDQGYIRSVEKYGGRIWIPKDEFGQWMISRMRREEEADDGVDSKPER